MKKVIVLLVLALASVGAYASTPDPGNAFPNRNYFIQDSFDSDVAYVGRVAQNKYGGGVVLRDVYAIANCRAEDNRTGDVSKLSWRYVRYHGLTGLAVPCYSELVEVRDRTQAGCCEVSPESGGADLYNGFQGIWWQWNHPLPQGAAPPIR